MPENFVVALLLCFLSLKSKQAKRVLEDLIRAVISYVTALVRYQGEDVDYCGLLLRSANLLLKHFAQLV